MYLFDLHCDTVTRLCEGEQLQLGDDRLASNGAHIALDRMQGLNWCQCFAVFMPDELRGEQAASYFEKNYRYFCEQLSCNAERIVQVRTAQEILDAISAGKAAAMLTVEGGSVLTGDIAQVKRLAACGVKILTLTWNAANELASGSLTEGGFTSFGREAVGALERAGIVLDVSHLNDCGFWELAGFANRPFIATHSNARGVCAHPRNLTDEQFRLIVQRDGLVGLNFCSRFIAEDENVRYSQLAAHIKHFLKLGGEHTVALGSDYDGAEIPPWLAPAEKVSALYPLIEKDFGKMLADKLFFENAFTFFKRYEDSGG